MIRAIPHAGRQITTPGEASRDHFLTAGNRELGCPSNQLRVEKISEKVPEVECEWEKRGN